MTRAPPVRRLFFALWPDAPTLSRALEEVARLVPEGTGRPQRADQLHLTLEFLGSVPESRLQAVLEAGAAAAGSGRGDPIVLDRLEHWRRPEVLCLAASAVPVGVAALVESLRGELAARGFRPEGREFRPHLTLARKVRIGPAASPVEPLEWPVRELTLVESTTDPGGSLYTRLAAWPLVR